MTKAALREQRRAQRQARRTRQRIILGVIIVLVVAVVAYLVWNYTRSVNKAYPIGYLDSTPPKPSASAVTTASGLVYEDLQVGNGATVKKGDNISVNYTGWLADGTKFDSSLDRGQPANFAIGTGSVIAGWDEGVVGMRVNGTRLLVIPSSLGYGTAGYGTSIPPNANLTFEVQVVAIK